MILQGLTRAQGSVKILSSFHDLYNLLKTASLLFELIFVIDSVHLRIRPSKGKINIQNRVHKT